MGLTHVITVTIATSRISVSFVLSIVMPLRFICCVVLLTLVGIIEILFYIKHTIGFDQRV